jgi:hypothetical protein
MDVYEVNEIVLVLENVPGSLYKLSSVLSTSGLNIESINAYAQDDKTAVFRLITADPSTALKAIGKAGVPIVSREISKAYVVKLIDRPGELAKITEKIYKNGLDLESIYLVDRANGYTEIVLKSSKEHERLRAILKG